MTQEVTQKELQDIINGLKRSRGATLIQVVCFSVGLLIAGIGAYSSEQVRISNVELRVTSNSATVIQLQQQITALQVLISNQNITVIQSLNNLDVQIQNKENRR